MDKLKEFLENLATRVQADTIRVVSKGIPIAKWDNTTKTLKRIVYNG